MACLVIRDISKSYGGLRAVAGASFAIEAGELIGLIGPNGSGKTTLLNILSGHQAPDAGTVRLDDHEIQGLTPDALARRGVARMFQLTRIFRRMSVHDNLLVAGRALGLDRARAGARADELLAELGLAGLAARDAGTLSGGQMKLLEFGACFMVLPRLALLDEPFAAVHPTLKEIMARYIRHAHAAGQTILVVSHDMPVVVELCPRAICMNAGAVIADSATRAVLNDRSVIEAYLGGAAA